MTSTRLRLTFAGITAAVLALSACAVPGQAGAPGVTAQNGSHTVTNVEIDTIYQAWVEETAGQDAANRRQIITIELLRPQLLAATDELGYTLTRQEATSTATQWLRFAGATGEPSEVLIDNVEAIFALALLAFIDPEYRILGEIAQDVEANAVLSPRAGVFHAATFLDQVESAKQAALGQELGAFSYIEFQHVVGVVDADTPWLDRG